MRGNIGLLFLAVWPMAAALISYLIGRRDKEKRNYFADAASILEFVVAAGYFIFAATGHTTSFTWDGICGFGLYLELDGFHALYGGIAALMWMMTIIFSREYLHHYRNRNRYYLFNLLTCGATMGVFLSGDLFTAFVFFEIMSFTSYVLVVHDEKPGAMRAGETYIAVAVIGGMVMLMGLFLLYHMTGTLKITDLYTAAQAVSDRKALYIAGFLILFGFGAKAGMYPLHIWLPKAHPVAPAPASALLSGILTKVGIFGILAVSCHIFFGDPAWGQLVLGIGVITMFLGAFIAVFSIDLKRTLACSSMSQIGFILVGIGMQCLLAHENGLAAWGTVLHMVNHSLIKLVLFMAAGVVYMNLHQLDLNEIRGFGRGKPLLNAIFLSGALGIMGIPLFNGYVSKTLLHEGIVEYIELLEEAGQSIALYKGIEWIFLISGGLTVAYMTKLYICVFIEKNPYQQEKLDSFNGKYMNRESMVALGVPAAILPVLGVFPNIFMDGIGRLSQGFLNSAGPEHAIHYFSLTNLKGAVISITIGVVVYLFVIRTLLMAKDENGNRIYVNRWPAWLDLENLVYRPLVQVAIPFVCAMVSRFTGSLTDWGIELLHHSILKKVPIPERNPDDFTPGDTLPRLHILSSLEGIGASMSYGLILFGIGMITVILYVLVNQFL